MASKKFCCKKLEQLHEIKGYVSGKEVNPIIPAIQNMKHLLCVITEDLVSYRPAYFEIAYCPCCGEKLPR